jgi:hypothetical protein
MTTTVLHHFNEAFPGLKLPLGDEANDLASIPLDSICGADCKRVIDAAKTLFWAADNSDGMTIATTQYLRDRRDDALRFVLIMICG